MSSVARYAFIKKLLMLIVFIMSPALNASISQIDEREPGLMIWPEIMTPSNDVRIQADIPFIKQSVLSQETGEVESYTEGFTYSYDFGFELWRDLHFGVQFGQTRLPILNLSINFNFQYDLYKDRNFKFFAGAMYGGIIYPGKRWGFEIGSSYDLGACTLFITEEYILSERYFQGITNRKVANYLDFNLSSFISSIGLAIPLDKDMRFQPSVGYESSTVSNIRNEKTAPSNYSRSDGFIFFSSLLFYNQF